MSLCNPVLGRLAAAAAIVAFLGSGCTAAPPQDTAGAGGSATPSSAPAAPETARDGRTVLPTNGSEACGLVDGPAIQASLGSPASSLQPGQPIAERMPDGVVTDSCIHAFDPGGATTNALTVQIITYASEEEVTKAGPYALLNDPQDVPGLQHPAKYSRLALSDSTEFVLVSVNGPRVVKLIVALPTAEAWDQAAGRDALLKLAQASGL
jgi:hypothetical protein